MHIYSVMFFLSLSPIDVIHYIYCFPNGEPIFHTWSKFHLAIVYHSFAMVHYLIC